VYVDSEIEGKVKEAGGAVPTPENKKKFVNGEY